MVEAIAGLTATLLTVGQMSLQVFALWRSDVAAGVASATWVLASVQSAGLLILALAHDLTFAILANSVVGGFCVVVIALVCVRKASAVPLAAMVVALAGVALAVAIGSAETAGTVGAAAAALVWIPQAALSWRSRSADGLSLGFATAGALSSALWLVYAVSVGEWKLAVAPVAGMVSMAITIRMSRLIERAEWA